MLSMAQLANSDTCKRLSLAARALENNQRDTVYRFWPWERTKQRQRHGRWRCGECGKVFHAEHFLDHHAERSHLADIVPPVRSPSSPPPNIC